MDSQITLLVWPSLLLTEKHRTINHMIIFNDFISKFHQCSIEAFTEAYLMFFSICLDKKKQKKNKAEVIKFLGILKKYVSKNMSPRTKYIFVPERKAMFFA